ncbi:MAG: branched-chain amino acid ABC transporter permease [Candidatus Riflebacteria bacterium]|nr:branched-chain amino acid ABC transporter permease [Candidatus Riflebacteria bacterium]
MNTFLQVTIDGILNGMIYALVASGLSLTWGVMDVINFAHGEFLMAAMYLTYWLAFYGGVDPLVAWVAAGLFGFMLGWLVFRLVVVHCLDKTPMAALLATFGLSMMLKNGCLYLFSPNYRVLSGTWLEGKKIIAGSLVIPLPQLVTSIFALLMVSALYLLLRKTRLGWAIQATSMDREAAELMGIDTRWILTLVFALSGACVGVAGGLMPMYLAVHPEVGSLFSLIAFLIVAMGGFGSMIGAFFAALLIGLVESYAGFYAAPVLKYVAVFSLYLVVVQWRPKGLFGW